MVVGYVMMVTGEDGAECKGFSMNKDTVIAAAIDLLKSMRREAGLEDAEMCSLDDLVGGNVVAAVANCYIDTTDWFDAITIEEVPVIL